MIDCNVVSENVAHISVFMQACKRDPFLKTELHIYTALYIKPNKIRDCPDSQEQKKCKPTEPVLPEISAI